MNEALPAAVAGQRLDRVLAELLAQPRNQVQRWLRDGRLLVDGRPARPSLVLRGGEVVSGEMPAAAERETMVGEAGDLVVLHEAPDILVVDKPAGLTMHPGAGRQHGTLAHLLLHRYPEIAGVGGPGRPGIVHRLDKDTSGLVVVARTAAAYRSLTAAFAARAVRKTYVAIVYGTPSPVAGEIAAPVGRHPQRRREMAVVAGGKPGITRYRTRAAAQGIAWLEIDLLTGRTHQIRVHMKHARHPLVGDPVYGEARWRNLPRGVQTPLARFPRPALHAWKLDLGAVLGPDRPASFEAPIPEDLTRLWRDATGAEPPEPAR